MRRDIRRRVSPRRDPEAPQEREHDFGEEDEKSNEKLEAPQ